VGACVAHRGAPRVCLVGARRGSGAGEGSEVLMAFRGALGRPWASGRRWFGAEAWSGSSRGELFTIKRPGSDPGSIGTHNWGQNAPDRSFGTGSRVVRLQVLHASTSIRMTSQGARRPANVLADDPRRREPHRPTDLPRTSRTPRSPGTPAVRGPSPGTTPGAAKPEDALSPRQPPNPVAHPDHSARGAPRVRHASQHTRTTHEIRARHGHSPAADAGDNYNYAPAPTGSACADAASATYSFGILRDTIFETPSLLIETP
jgi:hypothetical protein